MDAPTAAMIDNLPVVAKKEMTELIYGLSAKDLVGVNHLGHAHGEDRWPIRQRAEIIGRKHGNNGYQ